MVFGNLFNKSRPKGFSAEILEGAHIPGKAKKGSSPVDDTTSGSITMEDANAVVDRSVKFSVTRDDDGCTYAYENDSAVSNSVKRKDFIINNGFVVKVKDENDKKQMDGKKLIEKRIKELDLQGRVSSMIINRSLYGFSVTKRIMDRKGDIVGLVDIGSNECTPIRDLTTGELGGSAGKNLDPDNKNKPVAIIQEGNKITYDSLGSNSSTTVYYYFSNDEVITIGNNDRGMFKGVSDVMKSLRYFEIKKTLENVVDLIARRFGPQVWITVGNDSSNLSDADIPSSYLRDSDGNLIDPNLARKNYKVDVMTSLNTEIQKWVDGDSLVQLAEYGITPTVINPSSKLFDYQKYIELMADFIKITVLGLDIAGRVDVTSGIMQDKLTRDIRDNATRERNNYENVLNKDFVNPILKANKFDEDSVYIEFNQLDVMDEQRDVEIEKARSDTIYNYMKGGWTKPPEYLVKKWGYTNKDIGSILNQNDVKEKAKEEKDEKPTGRKVVDDLNRGR